MDGTIELPPLDVFYDNERFKVKQFDYDKQYFPYYNARIKQMMSSLVASAKTSWPELEIRSLTSLAEADRNVDDDNEPNKPLEEDARAEHEETIIVGTLFKKMPRQPNILKELDDEKKLQGDLAELVQPSNFVSSEDRLYLQEGDESVELKGSIDIAKLCTGMCLAIRGKLNPNGSGFLVNEICFAQSLHHVLDPDRALPPHDLYVCLVSGLGFSRNMIANENLVQTLNLLYDLLTGHSATCKNKTIVNLIVAGNGIGKKARAEEVCIETSNANQASWNKSNQSFSNDSVKLLDKFLANVGQYTHVDIMAGALDWSLYLWPQQPLHPCLFPKSYPLNTIRSVTNPHRARYFGVDFLGTSGQNVDAIRSCTNLTEPIDIMRMLMECSHLSPTTPDILHGYPYLETDPLVLESYPDIFFVGNQPEFGLGTFLSEEGKQVKLVSIPAFEDKMMAVLVNLRNLQCEMFAFN